MRHGAALAPSAEKLMQAKQRAEDAYEGIDVSMNKFKNELATGWFDLKAPFLEAITGAPSPEQRKQAEAEQDKAIRRAAEEQAVRAKLTNEQLQELIEQGKQQAKEIDKAAFDFGDISRDLAIKGREAMEAARKRMENIRSRRPASRDS
jgi:hypothetical protein